MAQAHEDHSGTPLPTKLGIGEGARVFVSCAPEGFDAVLGPLPTVGAGLVDNKSASIIETYQGLQFVYRLKDRPR